MKKIKLNSWGRFTNIEAAQHDFNDITNLKKLLSQNKYVAVCRGRMEWGPRALGNRSILALANDVDCNEKLNGSKMYVT